ncbi:tRNA1(Val) (adenine(37)-N6)-methyltransferase [Yoonia sp. 208BN28-4]|uniref:tRNA1(Val) (adenine(37)-N6)-methyltransferase n=1 Tax=Yoonia sp. 208BN28-4 TaxID=3126505 RepID=UPI003096470F
MADDLTHDAFLGGQVMAWQPARGFRSGIDAVLLAAAVPATKGQTVLELGCGVGVASLCLNARVGDLSMTGVEVQPEYATLARRNCPDMQVVNADLRNLPADLRQKQFHHVMMNPPYYDRTQGTAAQDKGRDMALSGDTPLADWIDVAVRRLAPKGHLTLIQHMTRLPDVLVTLHGRLGSITVMPIMPRPNRAPDLFLLQARHSGRAPFVMRPPLLMHANPTHDGDKESYTKQLQGILRDGAKLDITA